MEGSKYGKSRRSTGVRYMLQYTSYFFFLKYTTTFHIIGLVRLYESGIRLPLGFQ